MIWCDLCFKHKSKDLMHWGNKKPSSTQMSGDLRHMYTNPCQSADRKRGDRGWIKKTLRHVSLESQGCFPIPRHVLQFKACVSSVSLCYSECELRSDCEFRGPWLSINSTQRTVWNPRVKSAKKPSVHLQLLEGDQSGRCPWNMLDGHNLAWSDGNWDRIFCKVSWVADIPYIFGSMSTWQWKSWCGWLLKANFW